MKITITPEYIKNLLDDDGKLSFSQGQSDYYNVMAYLLNDKRVIAVSEVDDGDWPEIEDYSYHDVINGISFECGIDEDPYNGDTQYVSGWLETLPEFKKNISDRIEGHHSAASLLKEALSKI